MIRALVVALLCIAQVAVAAPHQVLVLRAEGTADTASRTSVDTHVIRLAKNLEGKVEAGDITLTEAAAAVGCTASESTCKDEVLTTFGVDEMIATTVTATPTGLNVTVRRIARSGTRAAQTTIPAGKAPDAKLDTDIGPLFGIVAAAPAPEPKPAPVPQPATAPAPPPIATQAEPAQPAPPTAPSTSPASTAPAAPTATTVTAAPMGAVAQPVPDGRRGRRWQKVGMGVGAAMVLLSFVMWSQASDVQKQIDELEDPRTHAELAHLLDLEKRGDELAGGGNLFFLTGAVLGGASAYLYWRVGKQPSAQATRIAPTAFPHGAGVTLTIGGMP